MAELRPHPRDPDKATVASMFDMRPDEWLLAAAGDYQSAAAQTMKNDGSNLQNVVIVEWPARVNNSDEFRTVRLAMSPEDARGLAETIAHSAAFFDQGA